MLLRLLEPAVLKANLRVLRSNHEFWNGIMRFLTAKRTDIPRSAVSKRLEATWRTCGSPYRTREDHIVSNGALEHSERLLRFVVGLLFNIVEICTNDSSKRMIVSQKFSRHGLWPTCATDILPFGAGASYSTLLYWFTVFRDSTATAAFTNIILLCRPELTPSLMMPYNRRLLLTAVGKYYDVAAQKVAQEPALGEEMDPFFQARIALLGALLHGLVFGSGSGVDEGRALFEDVPDTFLRSVEHVLRLIEEDDERKRLAGIMDVVYNVRGVPLFKRPPEVLKAFHDLQPQLGGSYNVLYMLLMHTRSARVCSASECEQHERDIGRKLQRYSSCGVAQYCSRDCQRRHWKANDLSRKTVCASLKSIYPLLDLGEGGFVTAARALLSVEQVAVIYENLCMAVLHAKPLI